MTNKVINHPPLIVSGQFANADSIELNEEQRQAVAALCDSRIKTLVICGHAGTGKTTILYHGLSLLAPGLPEFADIHKFIPASAPAVVICTFTNRGAKNSRRAVPPKFRLNCHTAHAVLEYTPEFYEELQDDGTVKTKMRFVPTRTPQFPLASVELIIIDEGGMLSIELAAQLRAAAPQARFVILGDIYQLPPVYGPAILGWELSSSTTPVIELTKVYRQALDSPILSFAIDVKNGEWEKWGHKALHNKGKLSFFSPEKTSSMHITPLGKAVKDKTLSCADFGRAFCAAEESGRYDPEKDCILTPFRVEFGTIELNKYIANHLGRKRKEKIYEVIAGFTKHYFAVGDRVIFGRYEGTITAITRNGKYLGRYPKAPHSELDRWGRMPGDTLPDIAALNIHGQPELTYSLADVDKVMEGIAQKNEDRKNAASHLIEVSIDETGQTLVLEDAAEINSILFAYALTVHKAQGAEWERVFFVLHGSHAVMYSRELLYTGATRARTELNIYCQDDSLEKCIKNARIKGLTLREKAAYFLAKKEQRQKVLTEIR